MAKIRIDTLILQKGLVNSREKARALILAGEIFVDSQVVDKAGRLVAEDAAIEIKTRRRQYVSRGGYKIEGAAQAFDIDFNNKIVLDVGASTGGYTDYALQNGASKVYSLDVGYGQLDWKLRNDPRVVVLERTNIRYFTLEELGKKVDIITMDVSFISTTLIFPVLTTLLKDDGQIASLIKPQFEAGRDKVGKKGVVRDPLVHQEVLYSCITAAARQGLICTGISFSPIMGPKGNIEYFINLKKQGKSLDDLMQAIIAIVESAHQILEGEA